MSGTGLGAEWRAGWGVLLAAFVASGTGISLFTMAAGLFILPMQREFGWPLSLLVMGPVVSLLSALLQPPAGMLIDRYGARRVALVCFAAYALVLFACAAMPASPVAYFALAMLLGASGGPIGSIVFAKCVSEWFRARPGLPLSIMLSGVSTLAIGLIPLLSVVIATHGWRSGFLTLGALALFPGLAVAAAGLREAPVAAVSTSANVGFDGPEVGLVLRSAGFWVLFAACATAAVPVGGILYHIFAALSRLGFDAPMVGLIGSVFAVSIAAGRLLSGWMLDVVRPAWAVGSLFFGLAAAGALVMLFAADGLVLVIGGVAALGLVQGALGSFFAFYLLHLFGRRAYAKAFGINKMGVSLAVSGGGVLFGITADDGTYAVAFGISAALFAAAALLMALLGIVADRPAAAGASPREVAG